MNKRKVVGSAPACGRERLRKMQASGDRSRYLSSHSVPINLSSSLKRTQKAPLHSDTLYQYYAYDGGKTTVTIISPTDDRGTCYYWERENAANNATNELGSNGFYKDVPVVALWEPKEERDPDTLTYEDLLPPPPPPTVLLTPTNTPVTSAVNITTSGSNNNLNNNNNNRSRASGTPNSNARQVLGNSGVKGESTCTTPAKSDSNNNDGSSAHHAKKSKKVLVTSEHREWTLLSFCYECGRSAGVCLVKCSKCKEVCYCSHSCKATNWKNSHQFECSGAQRLSKKKLKRKQRPVVKKL